ncbi:hypothetical protein ACN38_g8414 [Penicillium nordicum]|uniref:Uncharacterized protein n=1 Tax=Penicillium nordicum TaxID=229535 RepID=A0A0M8P3Q2_9EURO|nr:hypothetical protein ACN38_g8414 [Penicillium nordicum]
MEMSPFIWRRKASFLTLADRLKNMEMLKASFYGLTAPSYSMPSWLQYTKSDVVKCMGKMTDIENSD